MDGRQKWQDRPDRPVVFNTSQHTPMCAPVSLNRQLLSEEEVKAQLEAERQKSAQVASLWNHVSRSRGQQRVGNGGRERNLVAAKR